MLDKHIFGDVLKVICVIDFVFFQYIISCVITVPYFWQTVISANCTTEQNNISTISAFVPASTLGTPMSTGGGSPQNVSHLATSWCEIITTTAA